MADETRKLNVFISYSRDDLEFADQLHAALLALGFGVTIDRESISGGDAWKQRLGVLIRDADSVVFVLSPSSARSPTCAWEVEEAVRLGKRIVPVPCRSLEGATPPPQLADLNYIYCYSEPKFPGSGFGKGLADLASALNTDLHWLREHTRYLRLAAEWEEVGRPSDRRLLSAADVALARQWVASRPETAAPPTALQLDFIDASEDEDARRKDAEAKRLKEMADAQTREAQAQRREADQARRVVWRTRLGLAAAIVLLLVASGLGLFANQQRKLAEQATQTANTERDNAIKANKKAQLQLDRANQAVAEAINNDLVFGSSQEIDSRARNALWNLALADDAVKRDFLAILASSPGETNRAAPGFAQIFRSLGLLKPSSADAGALVDTAISALLTISSNETSDSLVAEIKALAPKLAETQAKAAFDPLVKQLSSTIKPDALARLGRAIQALAPRIAEMQAEAALDPITKQIEQTTDPDAILALTRAVEELPAKPSETQTKAALSKILEQIDQATESNRLLALAQALTALAPRLSETQAEQALDRVRKRVDRATKTDDTTATQPLAFAFKSLAPRVSQPRALQEFDEVLRQIDASPDSLRAYTSGIALRELSAALTGTYAQQAFDHIREQIKRTKDLWLLRTLVSALKALPSRLAERDARPVIDLGLKNVEATKDPYHSYALVSIIADLPQILTEPEQWQVLDKLLKQWEVRAYEYPTEQLCASLELLAPRLSEEHAEEVFKLMLSWPSQMGYAANRNWALGGLAARLTPAQASKVHDAVLKQLGQETDSSTLAALAHALQVLAPKLTEAEVMQTSKDAAASLAWAAQDNEAAEWARALAAMPIATADRDRTLASAIAYPAAAGSATEVLLEAIRAGHPDAPAKEAGTEPALAWLAKTFPDVVRPPHCPKPLQPDLKCPLDEATTSHQ